MNRLFLAASAAALLTAAGTVPALAQSSTSSGASSMSMPSLTCRDLSGMDQQTARNVVFYLGGINAAAGSSSAMNSTTGSGSTTTSADAGTSGSADTTTGSSGSTSTTADAGSSGTTESSGTAADTTGSTTAAGSTGTSSGSSTSGSSAASGAVMAQLPGFSMINADQIISTCQSQPDMQLSTLLGTSSTAQ